MKYTVDNAHREFFSLYHWIEFENLVSSVDLIEINDAIDLTLKARVYDPQERHKVQDAQSLYHAGRDLWRDHPRIKQLACQRRLAEILADLLEQRPLRLAFDQSIIANAQSAPWQPSSRTLETMSSFRGLVGGVILCLKDCDAATAPFFPKKAGNGICIDPTLDLDLSQVYRGQEQRYLVLGYGKAVTLFVHQPDDAYSTTLREMGYNYGDRLVDRLHPVVIR